MSKIKKTDVAIKKEMLFHAQDLVYTAYDAKNHKQALKLMREAIQLSDDCSDAMLYLAKFDDSLSNDEKLSLLHKAISSGKRAIEYSYSFDEIIGEFWSFLETRPYIRAKLAMVEYLLLNNKKPEAIEHLKEILIFNENDNTGARYILLPLLIEIKDYTVAAGLCTKYENDGALLLYNMALLEFIVNGYTKKANKILHESFTANNFIPSYLLGVKKTPKNSCGYYSSGDKTEATEFLENYADAWLNNKDALVWLSGEYCNFKNLKKKKIIVIQD